MKYHIIKNIFFAGRLQFLLSRLILIMLFFTLSSCDKELDIKTDFPFELQVMPVPKSIAKGETITIRCSIKAERNYVGTQYYIRFFQFDGAGKLSMNSGQMSVLKPNDLYMLQDQVFRLYYVSEGNSTHNFDVWISDNRGHEQKVSFQFNASEK